MNVNSIRAAIEDYFEYVLAMERDVQVRKKTSLGWNIDGALDGIDYLIGIFEDWQERGVI